MSGREDEGRTGFTPGPWYCEAPSMGFSAIKAERPDGDILIFGLAAGADFEKRSVEECEANAALLVAAPDLYAAGQRVLDHLNARIEAAIAEGSTAVPVFDGIVDLITALAKARGEL